MPSRAWLVVALIAPLLAGYGVQALIERRPSGRILIPLIGTTIALASGIFLMLRVPAINGLAVLVGAGGFGLILWARAGRSTLRPYVGVGLIVVTFLDLALAGRGWLEWRTQESWLPPDQVHLAERLVDLGAYRVYSPTYSLQQQVAEDYHLRLFGGVDPFQLSGVVEAVEQGGGIQDRGYSVVIPPLDSDDLALANRDAIPNTSILGRWGVTHVVAAYPLDAPNLEQVDVVDGVYVYANRDPALTTDFTTTLGVGGGLERLARRTDRRRPEPIDPDSSVDLRRGIRRRAGAARRDEGEVLMRAHSRLPLLILALALAVVFYRLLLGDVLFWGLPSLQFYPWRSYAFDLVRAGQLPLWNPYNGAGAPLFANYQSSLLYPLSWLGFILPLAQTMSAVAVLHLFIAGWGMWRFTGELKFSAVGRGVSALAFGMTAYLMARLGTYPIVQAAAWLPWLLWAALRLLENGRARSAGLLAIFTGLLLLAGHAQTAWYSLLLVGLFALWWTLTRRPIRWARLGMVAGCVALGAGIAALQLAATAELLRQSQRSGGVDFDFAMNLSYAPARILNLFAPNAFGTPAAASYITGGAFFEDAVYVGVIPLIGAFVAVVGWVVRRRKSERLSVDATVPFWLIVVIVGFVLALGVNTGNLPVPVQPRAHLQPVPGTRALASVDGLRLERARRGRRDGMGARASAAPLGDARDRRLRRGVGAGDSRAAVLPFDRSSGDAAGASRDRAGAARNSRRAC